MLRVLTGSGWVCGSGNEPVKINVGDADWCPRGITHWHGGGYWELHFVHQAASFGGADGLVAQGVREGRQNLDPQHLDTKKVFHLDPIRT